MKISLKQRILNYIRRNYPNSIASGDIEKLAQRIGRTGSNATRRLRELQTEGLINVSYEGKKHHAFYTALAPKSTYQYEVEDGKIIIANQW